MSAATMDVRRASADVPWDSRSATGSHRSRRTSAAPASMAAGPPPAGPLPAAGAPPLAVDRRWSLVSEEDALLLRALKMDLCPWLSYMCRERFEAEKLCASLANGVALCRLAIAMEQFVQHKQPAAVRYNASAQIGHFYAEENIGCFISWLRSIGIRAPLSISLIMEGQGSVILLLCLLELARFCEDRVPPRDMPATVLIERRISQGLNAYASQEEEQAVVGKLRSVIEDLGLQRDVRVVKTPQGFAFDRLPPMPVVLLFQSYILICADTMWMSLQHFLKPMVMKLKATASQQSRGLQPEMTVEAMQAKIQELTRQLLVLEQHKTEAQQGTREQEDKNRELLQLLEDTQRELVARRREGKCDKCDSTIALKNAVEGNLLGQIAEMRDELQRLHDELEMLQSSHTASRSIELKAQDQDQEIAELRDSNDELAKALDLQRKQAAETMDELVAAGRVCDDQQQLIDELKKTKDAECAALQQKLENVTRMSTQKADELEHQLQASMHDFGRQQSEHERTMLSMQQHVEEYEERIKTLRAQHDAHLSECTGVVVTSRRDFEQQLTDLRKEADDREQKMQDQHTEEIRALVAKLNDLEATKAQQEDKIAEQADTILAHAERIRYLEGQLQQAQAEAETTARGLRELHSQTTSETEAQFAARLHEAEEKHRLFVEEHMRECTHNIAELRAALESATGGLSTQTVRADEFEARALAAEARLREIDERERLQAEAQAAQEREEEERRQREEEERLRREAEEAEQARLEALRREQLAREEAERLRLEEEDRMRSAEFRSELESLAPVMSDITAWLNETIGHRLDAPLTPSTLMQELSKGDVLCFLAEQVDRREADVRADEEQDIPVDDFGIPLTMLSSEAANPDTKAKPAAGASGKLPRPTPVRPGAAKSPARPVAPKGLGWNYKPPEGESTLADYIRNRPIRDLKFTPKAIRGSPEARANVDTFIDWARDLGLRNPDIFTPEDVLAGRNPRRVLYGLYDVARRARRLRLPRNIWFERRPSYSYDSDGADAVDKMLSPILNGCICQLPLRAQRMGQVPGGMKYAFGEDNPVTLQAKLDKSLLVRVGGGFVGIKEYLTGHDKCRSNGEVQFQGKYKALRDEYEKNPSGSKDSAGNPIGFLTTR